MSRVVSVDHKIIGIQYALTGFSFLLFGFALILVLRWQLAVPGQALPIVGGLLGETNAPGGALSPQFYNALGAMHGTIMVFLGVVPVAVGGFGNYLLPLQIGASDMAFPRINAASYWTYVAAGVCMLVGFVLPGGPAQSGWTSYPPLSIIATSGQTAWLFGIVILSVSSMLGAVNAIVTIVQLRAPGLSFMRLPYFVWTQLVTNFLLLLAFPPLAAAAIFQLMDRLAGTSFFLPSGLVVTGQVLERAGGGNPLLWQHLFWFLAHPEVYVLILPALGIVAEIIAINTRRPLFGYTALVRSAQVIGFLSFAVWAHHMFITGMGVTMSAFFQTTTILVSIPSVVVLTCLFLSLWGGSIRFPVPMLFALAFLPMFGLGGLTGLPLGMAAPGLHLHDTYYVIAHFHYIVAPGTLFALFAGVYHWFPKVTGRRMSEGLGRLHFAGTFVCMNLIFLPMFAQGLAGMNRRLYDGGLQYAINRDVLPLHGLIAVSAAAMALFQIPFVVNLARSLRHGRAAAANPWHATTLEWSTASPPAAGNFAVRPVVRRGPYEFSVPGARTDYLPQDGSEPA